MSCYSAGEFMFERKNTHEYSINIENCVEIEVFNLLIEYPSKRKMGIGKNIRFTTFRQKVPPVEENTASKKKKQGLRLIEIFTIRKTPLNGGKTSFYIQIVFAPQY